MSGGEPRRVVGVSLKTYFGHAQTVDWCRQIGAIVGAQSAVQSGAVEVVIVPSFPSLDAAGRALDGSGVALGAQDVSAHPPGAHTGDVTADVLAELGVAYAEIGHAERRADHGETDEVIAAKVVAAVGAGLTPLLCVGERDRLDADAASRVAIDQLDAALAAVRDTPARVVVAYEPVWAIGAAEPAPIAHIVAVCTRLREHLRTSPFRGSSLIYGGSAGTGLFSQLGQSVDGLFLGRFAHDPDALRGILGEIAPPTEDVSPSNSGVHDV